MRYEHFVLNHLDVRGKNSSEANCICPFHEDHSPSFRINLRTGLWLCNGCQERGNIHQLAARMNLEVSSIVSPDDIRQRLHTFYKLPQDRQSPSIDEKTLLKFKRHPYWKERGLSDKTILRFQLGYDPTIEKLTLPTRNSYGDLVGVIYRQLDDSKPKYINPKSFARGRSLYASWVLRDSATDKCALTEGPVDALSLWDIGIPAVALLGSSITPGQVKLLRSLGIKSCVLMFDNDSSGRKATDETKNILRASGGFRVLRTDIPESYKDPAEIPSELRKQVWTKAYA